MQLVNQRLREIWPACWPERDLGEMVAQAEARIQAALEAWQLTIDNRFDEGWMAVVLAVRGPTGESLVLKTSPDHPEAYKEALMAEHLPQGPSLRGVRDGGLTLLMQRADPGRLSLACLWQSEFLSAASWLSIFTRFPRLPVLIFGS